MTNRFLVSLQTLVEEFPELSRDYKTTPRQYVTRDETNLVSSKSSFKSCQLVTERVIARLQYFLRVDTVLQSCFQLQDQGRLFTAVLQEAGVMSTNEPDILPLTLFYLWALTLSYLSRQNFFLIWVWDEELRLDFICLWGTCEVNVEG